MGLFGRLRSVFGKSGEVDRPTVMIQDPLNELSIELQPLPPQGIHDAGQYWNITSSRVSHLMGNVPNLVGAAQLGRAYKVVFPPGASGKLMRYSNGLLGTPIVNGPNRIAGHAGLKALSGPGVALGVFSVLAAVTGQYFMTQVYHKIGELYGKLDYVERAIDATVHSETAASLFYIKHISDVVDVLCRHECLRLATLTNVQRANIAFLKNIRYYEEMSKRTISQMQVTKQMGELEERCETLLEHVFWWSWATEGYCYGKVIEARVALNMDADYLMDVAAQVRTLSASYSEFVNAVQVDVALAILKSPVARARFIERLFGLKTISERAEELCEEVRSQISMVKDRRERWQVVAQQIEEVAMLDRAGMELIYDGGHVFVGCASRGGSVTKTLTA